MLCMYHSIKFVQSLKNCCKLISEFCCIITGVQCDPDPLLQENIRQKNTGQQMVCFKDQTDDAMTKFYTRLPSFALSMFS